MRCYGVPLPIRVYLCSHSPAAMAKLEFSVEVAAPVDRVFVFFVPQRMVYWYAAEMQAEFEVQDGAVEFAVGQKVRITGRLAGREVSLTAVVTRYEWLRALAWRFQDAFGVRGMQSWELEPMHGTVASQAGETPAGTSAPALYTRVTMRDEYDLPGWFGRLWDWLLMRHAIARRDRAALALLRRLAERS